MSISCNVLEFERDPATLTPRQKKPQAGVLVAVAVGVKVGKGVLVFVGVDVAVSGNIPSGAPVPGSLLTSAKDSPEGTPADALDSGELTVNQTPNESANRVATKMTFRELENNVVAFLLEWKLQHNQRTLR
ncbi:MAG: hypothetical protein M3328_15965 [Chloroflexota bacterium]|nr:hypothetical protein [Chloroflexota bacterium]